MIDCIRRLIAAQILVGTCSLTASAAVYTVTTTNDAGAGSLRQGILYANGNPDSDTIQFNITTGGPRFTIKPASDLPTVTAPVIIDGYSQPSSKANSQTNADDAIILIGLDGSNLSRNNGLRITGGNSSIRGLVISGFAG